MLETKERLKAEKAVKDEESLTKSAQSDAELAFDGR